MKYLALLTPAAGKSVEDITPYIVAEIKAVWASYTSDALREFYFSQSPPIITLIYEVANEASLHAELDRLPMIEEKLLDRQVVALGAFVHLQALFDKNLMAS